MKECTLSMRKSCKIWPHCSAVYAGGEDLPPCTKESPSTEVQQLKAEIAALATELSSLSRSDIYNGEHDAIAEKLRQLSAV
jgi:hypothetical protein